MRITINTARFEEVWALTDSLYKAMFKRGDLRAGVIDLISIPREFRSGDAETDERIKEAQCQNVKSVRTALEAARSLILDQNEDFTARSLSYEVECERGGYNARFVHRPTTGDILTISHNIRDYILGGIGLLHMDIHACDWFVIGELSKDRRLQEVYANEPDLYEFIARHCDSNAPRREIKKQLVAWLNGGGRAITPIVCDVLPQLFPTASQYRSDLMNLPEEARIYQSDGNYTLAWAKDDEDGNGNPKTRASNVSRCIQAEGAARLEMLLGEFGDCAHLHDCVYIPYTEKEKAETLFKKHFGHGVKISCESMD